MYPAGRHLFKSKVSFDTAVQPRLLAALCYGADKRFIRKAECCNLDFRFEFSVYRFRI